MLRQHRVVVLESGIHLFLNHRPVVTQNAVELLVKPRIAGIKNRSLKELISGGELIGMLLESGVEFPAVVLELVGQGPDNPLIFTPQGIDLGVQLLISIAKDRVNLYL